MITDGGKENKKSFRETVKKDADDIKLNPLDANTLIEQIKANLEILEGPEPATQGGPFGSGFGYTRFIGMNLDIGLCWSDYWAKRPHSFTTEARELQVA